MPMPDTPTAPDAEPSKLPSPDETPSLMSAASAPPAGAEGPRSVLDDAPLRVPQSPGEIFRVCTRIALQGFGGVLPIIQREWVEKERWLTREQFLELLAVSQVMPGPNVVNLALIFGDRAFGLRGAMAGLGGMLLVPLGVVLVLTVGYIHYASHPVVAGVLRGMGAAAAGLIFSTGIKLLSALRRNVLGWRTALAFVALMFAGIALAGVPLIWMLAGLGIVACALAWRRLAP